MKVLVLLLAIFPARVFASAAETVCIQCHSGQAGRLGAPVAKWQGSIHALNRIGCHDCHGGDPADFAMAMSSERGFLGVPNEKAIPVFCGRCHPGVLENYQASPHGEALGAGGPQCVTCHGSHAVQKSAIELINPKDCSRCHDYGRAEEIRVAMNGTEQRIEGLRQEFEQLHSIGIATEQMEGEVFAARNAFHRLTHRLDAAKVRQETESIATELRPVRERIAAIEAEQHRRRLWGGGAVALLLAFGAVAWLLHRDYVRGESLSGRD